MADNISVELLPGDPALNQYLLRVTRELDEAESEQLRVLLSRAWNQGWAALHQELEKQKDNPSYPITRIDPYAQPCPQCRHPWDRHNQYGCRTNLRDNVVCGCGQVPK